MWFSALLTVMRCLTRKMLYHVTHQYAFSWLEAKLLQITCPRSLFPPLCSAAHRAQSMNKTSYSTYMYNQSNIVITSYPCLKLATVCVQHQGRRKCSCVCWKYKAAAQRNYKLEPALPNLCSLVTTVN